MDNNNTPLYLGFDLSTQQLKAVVVNEELDILHETSVHFDSDLPEFRTQGGVHRHPEDAQVVTAPVLMWVKAVDLVMDKLKLTGVDLSLIQAISGSGQQHGSVYWRRGSRAKLASLNESNLLHKQLDSCFALNDSPIWMDSSTREECKALEKMVGGPQALANITGSRAYERFTGSQILKIRTKYRDVYEDTERISLVSSFLASIFLGSYADIDISDGSGMNLLNIHTHSWEDDLVNGISTDLKDKLGDCVTTGKTLGLISKYFVNRYGLLPTCTVASFTGDNPSSLVGMCLEQGDIAVSLGTSDTVFLWLDQPHPDVNGHILCNPLEPCSFMALLCYKNGSITRERVSREAAEEDWKVFSQLLNQTPRGNFGNIGFHFDLQEIYPLVSGDYRFNKYDAKVSRFYNEVEVRACIEGQFLRLRAHAQDLGYNLSEGTRVLATGGASTNMSILQVLSDIFNSPVYVQDKPNSAAAGGAFLARFSVIPVLEKKEKIASLMKTAGSYRVAVTPAKDADSIYTPMLDRYRKLEKVIQTM